MRTRAQVRRVAVLAAMVVVAVLLGSGGSARAAVTTTSGSAFGLQVRLLGLDVIAPTPVVKGGPAPGYPMTSKTAAAVGVLAACPQTSGEEPGVTSLLSVLNAPMLGVLDVCGATVSSFGGMGATTDLNAANARATIATATVGASAGALSLEGVTETCKADGGGATAGLTLANGSANGAPLASDIAPNSRFANLPGILEVVLNAQTKITGAGTNGIAADAARVTLLDNTVVVLGHVDCLAAGTANQVPPSSSSTLPPSSSTLPPTTTSTSSPIRTTSTTAVPPSAVPACNGRPVDVGRFSVGERFVLPLSSPCSFVPGGAVSVTVNGANVPGKSVNPDGFVTLDITILSSTQLSIDDPVLVPAICGLNTISVTGASVASGTVSQPATFTAACTSVTNTTGAPTSTIPRALSGTGSPVPQTTALALFLIAVGVHTVFASRRRPSDPRMP